VCYNHPCDPQLGLFQRPAHHRKEQLMGDKNPKNVQKQKKQQEGKKVSKAK
jgi:hypothetical protein